MNREVYDKIVKASGIQAGDLVVIQYWAEDCLKEDVISLQAAVAKQGATPLMLMQSVKLNQQIFENATKDCFGEKYFSVIKTADVFIDLIERPISMLMKPLEKERMDICMKFAQEMFQTSVSCRKMLQIRIPTKAMAEMEGIEPEEFAQRMESAMNIDYDEMKQRCEKMIEGLTKHKQITITTGENGQYALTFSLEGRVWNADCGDGDLPCGEVYISPIENETNGEVYFEQIYLSDLEHPKEKKCYEKVVFTVENGLIISANHAEIMTWLEKMGKEQVTVCELGFGLNEHVTSLCGCAVLDEKMNGTFHIGIGDNTMFGGENEADIHMDFIGKIVKAV